MSDSIKDAVHRAQQGPLARAMGAKRTATVGIYRCLKHPTFWSVIVDEMRITPSKCCGSWDLVKEWKKVTLE